MYNRYISEDTPYVPIQEAEHPQGGGRSNSGTKGHGPASTGGFRFSSLFSGKEGLGALLGGKEGAGSLFSSGDGSGGLSGLLKALKLEDIDPGGYPSAAYHPVSFGGRRRSGTGDSPGAGPAHGTWRSGR